MPTTITPKALSPSAGWTITAGELVALCNFNPVKREHYRIGAPFYGTYTEVFNTDAAEFGGQGITNGTFDTDPVPMHGIRAVYGADDSTFIGAVFPAGPGKEAPRSQKGQGTGCRIGKPAAKPPG